jgi:hypothetical protein
MPQQLLNACLSISKTKNVVRVQPINPVPHVPFEQGPQFRAISLAPERHQGRLLVRRWILEQQAPPQGVIPDHVHEELHENIGLLLVLLELKHHVAKWTFLEPGNGQGL